MKPALTHRLVGLCVFSTLTIAAFSLKMVWWELNLPATQRIQGIPAAFVLTVVASVTSVASWREKPWGYILAVLLCARENIGAMRSFYSQPAGLHFGDVFAVALSGVPLTVGMTAGVLLLVNHYSKKEAPLQSLRPAAPSRRD